VPRSIRPLTEILQPEDVSDDEANFYAEPYCRGCHGSGFRPEAQCHPYSNGWAVETLYVVCGCVEYAWENANL
jgi:hypothetical protein